MGWDAHAKWNKKIDKDVIAEFNRVADYVVGLTGHCDGGLRSGYLDCSDAGKMLETATKKSVYMDMWINTEAIWEDSNWDFGYKGIHESDYFSAYGFLQVCGKFNLDIRFSW